MKKRKIKDVLPEFQVGDEKEYQEWKKFAEDQGDRFKPMWDGLVKWAKLMESALAEGQSVVTVAHKLVYETDIPRLPNNGWSITILYQCWKFGADLEKLPAYKQWCVKKES